MLRMTLRILMVGVVALALGSNAAAKPCGFTEKFKRADEQGTTEVRVFEGAPVSSLGGIRPLLFISSLKINTDGTRISYHQDDVTGRRCATDPTKTPCAINNIRNAYRNSANPVSDFEAVRNAGFPLPKTWSVLSEDIIEKDASSGKPCITADGYLVSMTADVAVTDGFDRQGDCDQSKWIDALTMPGLVLPKSTGAHPSEFRALGVRMRSAVIGFSRSDSRHVVPGIVGDLGPVDELGEANIAMNRALNGLGASDLPKHRQDAINRFQVGKAAMLLFPGGSQVLPRPLTGQSIYDAGTSALTKFGGAAKVYDCIRTEVDPSF